MSTLRTPETEEKYRVQKKIERDQGICAMCTREDVLKEFEHWKILENLFPYDKIAKINHIVVTKKHFAEAEVPPEAWVEFKQIKKDFIAANYDCILENMPKAMTIPAHFHIHLISFKD
jgi:hypothetical protein